MTKLQLGTSSVLNMKQSSHQGSVMIKKGCANELNPCSNNVIHCDEQKRIELEKRLEKIFLWLKSADDRMDVMQKKLEMYATGQSSQTLDCKKSPFISPFAKGQHKRIASVPPPLDLDNKRQRVADEEAVLRAGYDSEINCSLALYLLSVSTYSLKQPVAQVSASVKTSPKKALLVKGPGGHKPPVSSEIVTPTPSKSNTNVPQKVQNAGVAPANGNSIVNTANEGKTSLKFYVATTLVAASKTVTKKCRVEKMHIKADAVHVPSVSSTSPHKVRSVTSSAEYNAPAVELPRAVQKVATSPLKARNLMVSTGSQCSLKPTSASKSAYAQTAAVSPKIQSFKDTTQVQHADASPVEYVEKINDLEAKYKKSQAENADGTKKLKANLEKIQRLENDLLEAQRKLKQIELERNEGKKLLSEKTEKMKALDKLLNAKTIECDDLSTKHSIVTADIQKDADFHRESATELQKKLDVLSEQSEAYITQLEEKVSQYEADAEKSRAQLAAANKEIVSLKEQTSSLSTTLKERNEEHRTLTSKVKALHLATANHGTELGDLKSKLALVQGESAVAATALQKGNVEKERILAELKSAKKELDAIRQKQNLHENELFSIKKDKDEALEAKSVAEKEAAKHKKQVAALTTRASEAEQNYNAKVKEVAKMEKSLSSLLAEKKDMESVVKSLETKIKGFQGDLEKSFLKLTDARKENGKIQAALAREKQDHSNQKQFVEAQKQRAFMNNAALAALFALLIGVLMFK